MSFGSITWQVVIIVLAVLGGATFLAYSHDLDAQTVGALYSGVIAAVLIGHYATRGGSSGGGP